MSFGKQPLCGWHPCTRTYVVVDCSHISFFGFHEYLPSFQEEYSYLQRLYTFDTDD